MAKHPESTFKGIITEHGVEESKNNNPQIVFKVAVDRVHDPVTGEFKEYSPFIAYIYQYPTTQESIRITGEILKSLGITDASQLTLEAGKSPCIGKEVEIRNKHDEYNGEIKDRFSFSFGSKPIQNSANAIQKLKGMFGNSLKSGAAPAKKAAPAAPKKQTVVTDATENDTPGDDIPF